MPHLSVSATMRLRCAPVAPVTTPGTERARSTPSTRSRTRHRRNRRLARTAGPAPGRFSFLGDLCLRFNRSDVVLGQGDQLLELVRLGQTLGATGGDRGLPIADHRVGGDGY